MIWDSKTVTQKKAYWKLPTTLKDVEYRLISEIDFTSAKTKRHQLHTALEAGASVDATKVTKPPRVASKSSTTPISTDAELNSVFDQISKCGIKPVILNIIHPYSDHYVTKTADPSLSQALRHLHDPNCTLLTFDALLKHCENVQI